MYRKRTGKLFNETYNDVIIACDTETSKTQPTRITYTNVKHRDGSVTRKRNIKNTYNIVVLWTCTINIQGYNVCTVWGRKPSEFCKFIKKMHEYMQGDKTYIYFHNMPYDYTFLRRFLFDEIGTPVKQLNIKSHQPLTIDFENGIQIRDSLMLAQRSLERWAKDLDVEHKKAVGTWDYNKFRTQFEEYTETELTYAEFDTLALAECLHKMCTQTKKNIANLYLTATGIPREKVQKLGKENSYHDKFLAMAPDWLQYQKLLKVYHGGYVHGNRDWIEKVIRELVKCYDFASSYPYSLIVERYPMDKFRTIEDITYKDILETMDDYAYMFKLTLTDVCINKDSPMPPLQQSKAIELVNPVLDNGRVLECDKITIYITEQDLDIIIKNYEIGSVKVSEVEYARKDYLPKWFTDFIFESFVNKTKLKGGDPVEYALSKTIINALYGMCVQQSVKEVILEDYSTGEYKVDTSIDMEEMYQKYLNKHKSILPYQWGVWCTAYAFHHLYELGACCTTWLYSDTDSCYGIDWDEYMVSAYNKKCIEKLKKRGYGGVEHHGKIYYLGVAESEGLKDQYSEFKVMGAKRYCGRCMEDGKLHITVAGVPKKGAECLKDNIENFTNYFIFDGKTTGKLLHSYIYQDDIYVDDIGNEVADSIDLCECDYELKSCKIVDLESFDYEERYEIYA